MNFTKKPDSFLISYESVVGSKVIRIVKEAHKKWVLYVQGERMGVRQSKDDCMIMAEIYAGLK